MTVYVKRVLNVSRYRAQFSISDIGFARKTNKTKEQYDNHLLPTRQSENSIDFDIICRAQMKIEKKNHYAEQ